MTPPNRNFLWTSIVVDELARSGLRAVVIAPGSRSTPLAIAFAEHPDIRVYSIIDERSAAFFALGHALATDRPVAVVCSSGTATANFYPAIIEARYSGVPLLIMTGDRPPELRDSGANQTVDQVKMYGDHVLWSVDVALPESDPSALAIRSLRTLACRAYATANGGATSDGGGGMPRGAVHLNFPFRKPLEPIPVPTDKTDDLAWVGRTNNEPFTRIGGGAVAPTDHQIDALIQVLQDAQRGIIIVGSSVDLRLANELALFAGQAHFPVLADPLSQIRYNAHWREMETACVGGYDTFLRGISAWDKPDLILRFGAMPTSQSLIDYLNMNGDAYQITFSADGIWKDPNHQIDEFIWANPAEIARIFSQVAAETTIGDEAWAEHFRAAESATWDIITRELAGDFFDGVVVADTVDLLPDGAALYIGNSLPVRHLDQFARPTPKHIRVFGNRGASGIDGMVSSALGAAAGLDAPLVLVTGDLGFYHDMNGLLAIKRNHVNAIIVVINNDGGGIFQRLPVAQFDPPYTELFRTPHGMTFDHVAAMYDLDYTQATDRASFRQAFNAALTTVKSRSTIIEVPTDAIHDLARRNEITQRVLDAIKTL
ncbi:MAG: 2-succinyl-5-enolpyruvyl-6-hydroxy-3-cyclohexene-1-carboxylic-acid synthase [Chloroflexota bacterium]|nr:2-succinyl-5-enolpyruvyl-6-hydroxy-3-cyclohexene-1-carboxylic-acid synthase [Chloroflexota bacterium]